jgi:Tfp pilus assembly protein PilO
MGVIVLFYVGDMGFRKFITEPGDKSARAKEQMAKKLESAKLELAESKRVVQQLEGLEQKSLPWDAEMARSRYQAWLLQLAQDAKLEGTSVDSGEPVAVTQSDRRSRKSVELYKRFAFSLRGRGELRQVTKFLYDFYRGGHLHKIRSLSLNPVGSGQTVDMNLSIEAIALPNADREAELTTLVSEDLALSQERDYQLIARRNFFGRGGTQSAWKEISLSAITFDVQGVGEAWFKVAGEAGTVMLQADGTLTRPSFDVVVVQLDEVAAIVQVDGQLYRIAIGQTLADAVPVAQ